MEVSELCQKNNFHLRQDSNGLQQLRWRLHYRDRMGKFWGMLIKRKIRKNMLAHCFTIASMDNRDAFPPFVNISGPPLPFLQNILKWLLDSSHAPYRIELHLHQGFKKITVSPHFIVNQWAYLHEQNLETVTSKRRYHIWGPMHYLPSASFSYTWS